MKNTYFYSRRQNGRVLDDCNDFSLITYRAFVIVAIGRANAPVHCAASENKEILIGM